MAAETTLILAPGLYSAIPAVTAVAWGACYPATDRGIIYRNTGSAWVAWSIYNPMTATGDMITRNSSGYVARVAAGINGDLLKLSGGMPAWGALVATDLPAGVVQAIFKQTADVTVVNTITSTSLLAANAGTKTIAANALAVGSSIRVRAWGYWEVNGGGSVTFSLKLGSVVLQALVPNFYAGPPGAGSWWQAEWDITCRTTGTAGTVMCQGRVFYGPDLANVDRLYGGSTPNTSTATIDTTTSNALDVTFEFSVKDPINTITATNAIIDYMS